MNAHVAIPEPVFDQELIGAYGPAGAPFLGEARPVGDLAQGIVAKARRGR